MAFRVDWYIPGQIVYTVIWGEQTVADGRQANAALVKLLQDGQLGATHVLVDVNDFQKSPIGIGLIRDNVAGFRHPNMGWLIPIGNPNPLIRLVGVMTARLFNLRFRPFATIEQALEYLEAIDPTIDWAQANPAILTAANNDEKPRADAV